MDQDGGTKEVNDGSRCENNEGEWWVKMEEK